MTGFAELVCTSSVRSNSLAILRTRRVISVTLCPSHTELKNFLLGRVEESSATIVEDHIQNCFRCSDAIDQLSEEDEFVQWLKESRKGRSASESKPDGVLINALIPLLKRLKVSTGPNRAHPGNRPSEPSALETLLFGMPDSETVTDIPPVSIGAKRIGPFELQQQIGQGGMGIVFQGHDTRLNRPVAIKFIRPELLSKEGTRELFLQEAQTAAAVEHDNIVAIYSVENHGISPYLVMPLLRGQTLQDLLEQTPGPLTVGRTLQIGREMAAGLAAAHRRGLIHRDIKPANVWLEETSGRVKLLDFGLACFRVNSDLASGSVAGTPGYMAPEQLQGQVIDCSADLFSMGCILYRAVTGQVPFPLARGLGDLLKVVTETPPALAEIRSPFPSDLRILIDQLLRKDPRQRPESADLVAARLKSIETAEITRSARIGRRRVMGGIAVVAAIVGVTFGMWQGSPRRVVSPVKPVQMSLVARSRIPPVVIKGPQGERLLDLSQATSLQLEPGDYSLKLAEKKNGRELVPSQFVVLADEPGQVDVTLVGEIARHEFHTQDVIGVAIPAEMKDLTVISASLDQSVSLWNTVNASKSAMVQLPAAARALAISPSTVFSNSLCAISCGNKFEPANLAVHILNSTTLKTADSVLDEQTRMVKTLKFSPVEKTLVTTTADGVQFWDLESNSSETLPIRDWGALTCLAFSPDGKRLIMGTEAGSLVLSDFGRRTVIRSFVSSTKAVRAVCGSKLGFLSAGDDGAIRLWNEKTFEGTLINVPGTSIVSLCVTPDSQWLLSGDRKGDVVCQALDGSRREYRLQGHQQVVWSIAVSSDGRLAATGSADRSVRLWQLPF